MIKVGEKKYLEIGDYAISKGKSLVTIYKWIKDKKIKSRKFLGKTLIEL